MICTDFGALLLLFFGFSESLDGCLSPSKTTPTKTLQLFSTQQSTLIVVVFHVMVRIIGLICASLGPSTVLFFIPTAVQ